MCLLIVIPLIIKILWNVSVSMRIAAFHHVENSHIQAFKILVWFVCSKALIIASFPFIYQFFWPLLNTLPWQTNSILIISW